jgi:SAM-dependent methyltransferase
MNQPPPRFWPIFFELYESLPRQGPGNHDCAARALALCRDLPPTPAVLDLGCGVGGQTLHLTDLTSGSIVALDSHAPSIERLRATVAVRGLAERIQPMVGDMAKPRLQPASFENDYPAMGRVPDVLAAIERSGFSLISHFTLPDEAWWDDFYTPMAIRIEELRGKYRADDEALAVLDQLAQEPEMHRRHSGYYAYEFFVARRVE